MVVKITKLGKLSVKKVYELKCSTCGTEFTCDMIDLRPSPDDRDNLWVYCPLDGCRRPVAWHGDRHDDR